MGAGIPREQAAAKIDGFYEYVDHLKEVIKV